MRDRLLKPAIDHRRLGQFLTGDWVKNIPALTQCKDAANYDAIILDGASVEEKQNKIQYVR